MKKTGAILCLAGGLLGAAKPIYDWLALGRRINTGYPASDPTDYVEFMFPLLCLGGLSALLSSYGRKLSAASALLALGLILHSAFQFSERYYPDFRAGFFFMVPGLMLLCIGAFLLYRAFRRMEQPARGPLRIAEYMTAVNLLFCIYPFVSGMLPIGVATGVMVGLMALAGLVWAWWGSFLLKSVDSMAR